VLAFWRRTTASQCWRSALFFAAEAPSVGQRRVLVKHRLPKAEEDSSFRGAELLRDSARLSLPVDRCVAPRPQGCSTVTPAPVHARCRRVAAVRGRGVPKSAVFVGAPSRHAEAPVYLDVVLGILGARAGDRAARRSRGLAASGSAAWSGQHGASLVSPAPPRWHPGWSAWISEAPLVLARTLPNKPLKLTAAGFSRASGRA
jgi:hypothetical protein